MTATTILTKSAAPAPTGAGAGAGPRYVERAELTLALADRKPLAYLKLTPDPLQPLVTAMAALRPDCGERADVVLDLVQVAEARVARRRRRLLAASRRRGPSAYGERLTTWWGGGALGAGGAWSAAWSGGKNTGRHRGERLPRMTDLREGLGKFVPEASPVFALQLLLRTEAAHPQAARARMNQLLAAFAITSGENYFQAHRPRTRRAVAAFERRLASGEFRPRHRQWLTVPELAGFLKPPTVRCTAPGIVRSGGAIPPAPADLPVYTGQPDLVPLGAVTYPDGSERIGAAPIADLLFALVLGKSGHGKTEEALLQAIALAHTGHGIWFLDPHGEAWARAKPYLAHPHIAERMWEINLTATGEKPVVSWNPLSMERTADVQRVVLCVTEGIAAAQDWGTHAPRARTILARTVQALALLNLKAVQDGRPDAQCTLFQIRTWLTDDEWRQTLLPHLPNSVRAYWTKTFPRLAADAVPTVTYAIDRLDTSESLRAFFGSPTSSYDAREAMDTRRVVFVCPSGSEADALVACLLIHDLHRAGLSRQDTPREKRATFWAWIDELTVLDASSRGFIAAICEQLRKYEVRLTGMTQMVLRLSAITRQALLQNRSLLATCAADRDEADFIARRWNGQVAPEAIIALPKYEQIMSLNLGGRPSTPVRVRGLPIDEVYAPYYNPAGIGELDEAIDRTMRRRPAADVLADLEALDEAVLAHHTSPGPAHPDGATDTGTTFTTSIVD